MKRRHRVRPARPHRRRGSTIEVTPNGRVRGLWTDDLALTKLGPCVVHRVSYIEFSCVRQCWCVRETRPTSWLGRLLRRLIGWPLGRLLHAAPSRAQALDWEHTHFTPDQPGWKRLIHRTR